LHQDLICKTCGTIAKLKPSFRETTAKIVKNKFPYAKTQFQKLLASQEFFRKLEIKNKHFRQEEGKDFASLPIKNTTPQKTLKSGKERTHL